MPYRYPPPRPIVRDYIADKFIEFLRPALAAALCGTARERTAAQGPRSSARHRVAFGSVICDFPATLIKGLPP
jgi:hypothetical protein